MGKNGRYVLWTWIVVIAALVLAMAAGALAASEDAGEAQEARAEVVIGGITVFRFTSWFKGVSPNARVGSVYRRLWHVLAITSPENRDALVDKVRVVKVQGDYCIMIGKDLIVTVDPIHAQRNRSSPQDLAEVWAKNLRQGLQCYLTINVRKSHSEG